MKGSGRGRRYPSKQEQPADDVVLRRWRKGGAVIALFPELPATMDGLVTSYQHVGQHGAADYRHVMSRTVPVPVGEADQERNDLLDEFRSIGYNPRVRRRRKGFQR